MYLLKPREEEIMEILWTLGKGFLKEILPKLKSPVPPYNTILSMIRKLEKEGYVGFEVFGKSHQYHPIISKKEYKRIAFKSVFKRQFDNSPEALFSFFIKEENVNIEELETLLKNLKKEQQ